MSKGCHHFSQISFYPDRSWRPQWTLRTCPNTRAQWLWTGNTPPWRRLLSCTPGAHGEDMPIAHRTGRWNQTAAVLKRNTRRLGVFNVLPFQPQLMGSTLILTLLSGSLSWAKQTDHSQLFMQFSFVFPTPVGKSCICKLSGVWLMKHKITILKIITRGP